MRKATLFIIILSMFCSVGLAYDYDVSGSGDDGYVYGDVTVDQSGGDGTIYDEYGNEHNVTVDWTGRGELEGYDEDGNYYELEVD